MSSVKDQSMAMDNEYRQFNEVWNIMVFEICEQAVIHTETHSDCNYRTTWHLAGAKKKIVNTMFQNDTKWSWQHYYTRLTALCQELLG